MRWGDQKRAKLVQVLATFTKYNNRSNYNINKVQGHAGQGDMDADIRAGTCWQGTYTLKIKRSNSC